LFSGVVAGGNSAASCLLRGHYARGKKTKGHKKAGVKNNAGPVE
jgi:hypothetical protein